ncbi:hypothetical protein TNCT_610231 [Trichonephila clavata]|uniref:Uncharacterized protein n=1 Tax=Trichonephila clavata TaxID=2740835 RepID=A0A8X6ILE5_TRICU|nr:hypothetical protein TNCT_610231 [Trichonephila clavata]
MGEKEGAISEGKKNRAVYATVNVKNYKKLITKELYVQLKRCDIDMFKYPLDFDLKTQYVKVKRCDEDKESYISALSNLLKKVYSSPKQGVKSRFSEFERLNKLPAAAIPVSQPKQKKPKLKPVLPQKDAIGKKARTDTDNTPLPALEENVSMEEGDSSADESSEQKTPAPAPVVTDGNPASAIPPRYTQGLVTQM